VRKGERNRTKAAELGDVAAHHSLAIMYHHGHGVEKDEKKKIYHWEEAAIGGHSWARHCLGNESLTMAQSRGR
jgi:TPR repeat protein